MLQKLLSEQWHTDTDRADSSIWSLDQLALGL